MNVLEQRNLILHMHVCMRVCVSICASEKSVTKGEEAYVVERILFNDQIKDQSIIMEENKDYKQKCPKTE